MKMTLRKSLQKQWQASGVCKDDVILLHTDVTSTLWEFLKQGYRITPTDILESFIASVGAGGTLVLPTFNFDFCSGIAFDRRNTPSQVGTLSEIARSYPGALRTSHPIFSFVAIGAEAETFSGVNNCSGFGAGSPFDVLHQMNGKIGVLDHPMANTFYHYIEEMNEKFIDYRYHKDFTADYVDFDGSREERTYSFFVRDLDRKVIPYVIPADNLMWDSGLYCGKTYEEGGLRTIDSSKMFDFISDIIRTGGAENNLYRIEGKEYE